MSNTVPDINSRRPFAKAQDYLDAGWYPIPVPPRSKFPPEIGFTGRNGAFPGPLDLEEWLKRDPSQNVALHMGPCEWREAEDGEDTGVWDAAPVYETIGIDVDHYGDKHGYDDLLEQERKLGALPSTWISSARSDGKSGIRYFRAPAGLSWKGKIGSSIDIVQKAHRFALVWPSIHPTAGQYRWYPPGYAPDGSSAVYKTFSMTSLSRRAIEEGIDWVADVRFSAVVQEIPYPSDLPLLPDEWIDFLTAGRIVDDGRTYDMESTADEIEAWAEKTFVGSIKSGGVEPESGGRLCRRTRNALERWKAAIDSDPSSHDKLLMGHFELIALGLEGHVGWDWALSELEAYWSMDVGSRDKRGLMEAGGEIWRSRINGIRHFKALVDLGERSVSVGCSCWDKDGGFEIVEERFVRLVIEGPDGGEERLLGPVRLTVVNGTPVAASGVGRGGGGAGPVESGDGAGGLGGNGGLGGPDEDGIGSVRHVSDPLGYERSDKGNAKHLIDLFRGDLRFVEGWERWIYWNGTAWRWDEKGLVKRIYLRMQEQKLNAANVEMDAALRLKAADQEGASELVKEARSDLNWAVKCGNRSMRDPALDIASGFVGISLTSDEIDSNVRLLGVENGLIELNLEKGFSFRQPNREDMVVSNTRVPYVNLVSARQGLVGAREERAVAILDNYLETFLPDLEVRAWVQQLLGYTLLGGNVEKKIIFLFGESNTGKTTILEAAMSALGEYAGAVEMEVFKPNKLNPALAAAMPRRMIITTEAASGKEIPADMIKRLTGNDNLSVEVKNSNTMISGKPMFVPVVGTNNAPEIEGFDNALKKRVEVVPFRNVAPPRSSLRVFGGGDPGQMLVNEAQTAVLAWLLEGFNLYAKHRLGNRPALMAEVQEEFHDDMNEELSEFKQYAFVEDPNSVVTSHDLFAVYTRWANKTGVKEKDFWSKVKLGRKMTNAGWKSKTMKIDGKAVKAYAGIRLVHNLKGVVNIKDE